MYLVGDIFIFIECILHTACCCYITCGVWGHKYYGVEDNKVRIRDKDDFTLESCVPAELASIDSSILFQSSKISRSLFVILACITCTYNKDTKWHTPSQRNFFPKERLTKFIFVLRTRIIGLLEIQINERLINKPVRIYKINIKGTLMIIDFRKYIY